MSKAKQDHVNHTGQELELMLQNAKPLSMFYGDPDEGAAFPENEFEGYVKSGKFVKGTRIYEAAVDPRTGRPVQTRYDLYALKSEEWRIPAMFLAIETHLKMTTKSEGLDRMISSLLGYTDEQIERYFSRGTKKKTSTKKK